MPLQTKITIPLFTQNVLGSNVPACFPKRFYDKRFHSMLPCPRDWNMNQYAQLNAQRNVYRNIIYMYIYIYIYKHNFVYKR